jgi:predicted ATPase
MAGPYDQPNYFVISGCSGGGKSALIDGLRAAGAVCVEEAGRGIVRHQAMIDGPAVPWRDEAALCELILSRNMENFMAMRAEAGPVYFDRGIPEAVGVDIRAGREPLPHHLAAARTFRYNRRVFYLPPWPEIFAADAERKHSFETAVREYEVLREVYCNLGYEIMDVTRSSVEERVQFVAANAPS